MDIEWLKDIIAVVVQHGPWAALAFFLVYKLVSATKRENDMIAAYHTAIVENTRVTERLAVLIEERTRATNGQG